MILMLLPTALSSSDKWELRSLSKYSANISIHSWESPIFLPLKVIQGVFPLGPIGSLKSFCRKSYCIVRKRYEITRLPHMVCSPFEGTFQVLMEKERCSVRISLVRADVGEPHLVQPTGVFPCIQPWCKAAENSGSFLPRTMPKHKKSRKLFFLSITIDHNWCLSIYLRNATRSIPYSRSEDNHYLLLYLQLCSRPVV